MYEKKTLFKFVDHFDPCILCVHPLALISKYYIIKQFTVDEKCFT